MTLTSRNLMLLLRIALNVFLITVVVNIVQAQPDPKNYITVIDSVRIKQGLLPFLIPGNIKDVHVVRNDPRYHRDVMYISLKDHDVFFRKISGKFLSPDVIARSYIPGYNKNSQVIFIWNDKLLIDTSEAGVPEKYFRKAEVIKTSKTAYAKTLPTATILKIYSEMP